MENFIILKAHTSPRIQSKQLEKVRTSATATHFEPEEGEDRKNRVYRL